MGQRSIFFKEGYSTLFYFNILLATVIKTFIYWLKGPARPNKVGGYI